MKRIATAVMVMCVVSVGAFAQSQYVVQTVKEAKWGPAPPLIPPGAQMTVLSGDPMKAGSYYSLRLKFPAHYTIKPHSHPTDENVVIVSGAVTFGMGEALVKSATGNRTLGTGGFMSMPAGMNHFAYTGDKEATLVLYGVGPVDFKYVNPADDPRAMKSASK